MGISEFVRSPRAFLAKREESGWAGVLAVLGIVVLPEVFSAVLSTWWLLSDTAQASVATYVISAAFAAAIPVVTWIVAVICIQVISIAAYTVEGSFSDLLRLTGFGMIPYAISSVFALLVTVTVLNGLTPPDSIASIQEQSEAIQSNQMVSFVNLLHVGFLLWCGIVWAAATSVVHEISIRKAALTVGVPIGALIALQLVLAV